MKTNTKNDELKIKFYHSILRNNKLKHVDKFIVTYLLHCIENNLIINISDKVLAEKLGISVYRIKSGIERLKQYEWFIFTKANEVRNININVENLFNWLNVNENK